MIVEITSSDAFSAEGLFGIRIAKFLVASPLTQLLDFDSRVVADILDSYKVMREAVLHHIARL